MPNITRGGNAVGLMAYLFGGGRANEHSDQHLIAGHDALVATFGTGRLDHASVLQLGRDFDLPSRAFGTSIEAPLYEYDGDRRIKVGWGDAHVWHCSLSLKSEEGQLPDGTWAQIAQDFVRRMEFDDSTGRAPCQWVAVRHGTSAKGNDHIHVVVNLVREDGTKARVWKDQVRAQAACNGLERAYGLQVVEARELGIGERGVKPGELAGAARQSSPELVRVSLARRVRACAAASADEAEFVRRCRRTGLRIRPRYAKGSSSEVIGYSVAERTAPGQQAVWFGGGKLAKDLTVTRLRQGWSTSDPVALDAEWAAAFKGTRMVGVGRENEDADPRLWGEYAEQLTELRAKLSQVPVNDSATWAQVARESAGAFAAWSVRVEGPRPGPLAKTSRALAKYGAIRSRQVPVRHAPMPAFGGIARLVMAAGDGGVSKRSQAVLLRQMVATLRALYDVQHAAGHLQSALATERAVREELFAVARGLGVDPTTGTPSTPAGTTRPLPGSVPTLERPAHLARGDRSTNPDRQPPGAER